MDRRKRLLSRVLFVVALCLVLGQLGAASAFAAGTCTARDRAFGHCGSAASTGDSVVVRAVKENRIARQGRPSPKLPKGLKNGARVKKLAPTVLSASKLQDAFNAICVGDGDCGVRQGTELNPLILDREPADPVAPADDGADGEPVRVVTIEDVARFLPATVTLHAEPDGWAVVGVHANFWTYVRPVTVEGALLGEQASVRFTPQVYRWDYGDGSSRMTRSGGASWSGLRQQELTSTSTSHLYRSKAAVNSTVTVLWSAEYRFAGSDWIPVAGAVSNSSPDIRILVVKERTVLTAG